MQDAWGGATTFAFFFDFKEPTVDQMSPIFFTLGTTVGSANIPKKAKPPSPHVPSSEPILVHHGYTFPAPILVQAPKLMGSSLLLLLDDQGTHIVAGDLVVLDVGPITVRELCGPPAPAHDQFILNVWATDSVHHLGAVLLDVRVDHCLLVQRRLGRLPIPKDGHRGCGLLDFGHGNQCR